MTLDLNAGTHSPYLKPGNIPTYVNAKSNHPPNVIRAIPKGITHRHSDISSNQEEFYKSTRVYQEALEKSGYNLKLEYNPKPRNKQNNCNEPDRSRKRNITWYNPPFDLGVKTNVGKLFFKIVDESFPAGHILQTCTTKSSTETH